MKKQKIQMIVLMAVLVLCVGGYFGASALTAQKQAEEESESTYTAVSIESADEITAISVVGPESSYDLVKEDGTWKFKEDIETNVDQDTVETMAESLLSVTGDNEITDVTDFEQYGLDEPEMTITYTLSDESTHTIGIGDRNNTISRYYLRVDDENTVYTVTSTLYNRFDKTAEDLIDTSEDVSGNDVSGNDVSGDDASEGETSEAQTAGTEDDAAGNADTGAESEEDADAAASAESDADEDETDSAALDTSISATLESETPDSESSGSAASFDTSLTAE